MTSAAMLGLDRAAELVELAGALAQKSIPSLSFKGPTLAHVAYGSLAARHSIDLDFLFRPEDASRANEVFFDLGYEPLKPVARTQWPVLQRVAHHWRLIHPASGMSVEPHWRLLPMDFAPRLDLDAVWDRRQSVTIGGTAVWTLGTDDLTLYVALHGYLHRWQRLQWLEDLHALIRRHPEIDWDAVVRRAGAGGVVRALYTALALSRRIFGTDLPRAVRDGVQRAVRIRRVADSLELDVRAGRKMERGPWRDVALFRFRLGAHDRAHDRWRLLARTMIVPTEGDLRWIRLPRRLHLLYYLLRPARLLLKYVGYLARRGRRRPQLTTRPL